MTDTTIDRDSLVTPIGTAKESRRPRKKGSYVGLFFALPAAFFIIVFMLVPVLIGFGLSFTDYSPLSRDAPAFIGIANYARILTDGQFLRSLGITLRYVLQVLPPLVIIALLLAMLANKPFKGVGVFRSALYLPHIISLTAVSMIWLWIYSGNGLINELFGTFGLSPQRWLFETTTSLTAVSVMRIWKALGSNMVLLLAGLQGIPKELYEAARVDGAGRWHQFRYVTLPGLRPMLTYVMIMNIIFLSQSFAEMFVLTQGGPAGSTTTINYLIYQEAFQFNSMGSASAMAFVLFAFIGGLSMIALRGMTGKQS